MDIYSARHELSLVSEGGEQRGIARFFEDIDSDQTREYDEQTAKL